MTQPDPLQRLREVMDRLRSPGGCPWDREQDHHSLTRYLLEESYELIDAIEGGDREEIVEELGDVLLQVFFHARIGQERETNPFDIDVVADRVADKLVKRHPHVFASESNSDTPSSDQVVGNWERIKNEEKSRDDIFDGVPLAQPSLSLATKYLQRALKNARPLPERTRFLELGDLERGDLERGDLERGDLERGDLEREDLAAEEIGVALLALIRVAVEKGIDPESELRRATMRYAESIDRRVKP